MKVNERLSLIAETANLVKQTEQSKSRKEQEMQKRLETERNRSLNALRGGQKGPVIQPPAALGQPQVSVTPPGFRSGQFKPALDMRPVEEPISRQMNNDLDPRRRRASSNTNPTSNTPTTPIRLPINPDLLPRNNPNPEPQSDKPNSRPVLNFSDDSDDDPFQILDRT